MGLLNDSSRALKSVLRTPFEWSLAFYRTLRSSHDTARALHSWIKLWQSTEVASTRTCYFASFDPDGWVDEYVFSALEEWRRAGFQIVFVTTSPSVRPHDLMRLRELCRAVIHRRNLGYDFFSWKVGMTQFPPAEGGLVVWTNDSVYGPITPLKSLMEKCQETEGDIVGLTDSWAIAWHLQSYFLLFRPSAAPFLWHFLESIVVERDKSRIVKRFEVGLSQSALRAGLQLSAVVDFRTLDVRYGPDCLPQGREPNNDRQKDPTVVYAVPLVRDGLSPFLKVAWVRDDPLRLGRIGPLNGLGISGRGLQQIVNHQKRRGCGLVP